MAATVVLLAGIGLGAAMIARGGPNSSIDPAKAPTIPARRSRNRRRLSLPPLPLNDRPGSGSPRATRPLTLTISSPITLVSPSISGDWTTTCVLVFLRERVYIPEGYEPESLNNLVGAARLA